MINKLLGKLLPGSVFDPLTIEKDGYRIYRKFIWFGKVDDTLLILDYYFVIEKKIQAHDEYIWKHCKNILNPELPVSDKDIMCCELENYICMENK